jgi:RimJ/RimL family protein N-acetyltransferase
VFRKSYASMARFLRYEHECAYLLAKGRPALPASPVPDVLDWKYSGNRLHPTQKPVEPMKTLIDAFSRPGDVVLDPFCGSGSTLQAARELGRNFIGIELDPAHHRTARNRLADHQTSSFRVAASHPHTSGRRCSPHGVAPPSQLPVVNGLLAALWEQCGMVTSFHDQASASFAAPVVTPRLVIRPWQDGDEKAVAEFLNADGGNFPRRYHHYAYNVAGLFNEARVRNEVFPAMHRIQQDCRLFELYIYRKTDNRIIGLIEFTRDQIDRDRVSYFILPSERTQGYAFEAYAACINKAVDKGFLAGNLYAHTDPDNTVSQKFLEKAGFQNLGKLMAQNKQGESLTVVAFTRALSTDKPVEPR